MASGRLRAVRGWPVGRCLYSGIRASTLPLSEYFCQEDCAALLRDTEYNTVTMWLLLLMVPGGRMREHQHCDCWQDIRPPAKADLTGRSFSLPLNQSIKETHHQHRDTKKHKCGLSPWAPRSGIIAVSWYILQRISSWCHLQWSCGGRSVDM